MKYTEKEIKNFREEYHRRRSKRIILFYLTLAALVVIGIIIMPFMDAIGMPRRVWGPFAYAFIFGLILASAYVWKCPACKSQLGDIFSTKYCPKCGLKFYDEIK